MAQEASSGRLDSSGARSVGSGLVTILLAAVALLLPLVERPLKSGLGGGLLLLAGRAEGAGGD